MEILTVTILLLVSLTKANINLPPNFYPANTQDQYGAVKTFGFSYSGTMLGLTGFTCVRVS